jgi:cytochrome b
MSDAEQRVWDLPTRLFHWAMVAIVLAQWCSGEWNLLPMEWHFRLGYATLALVLFRIGWGFLGSDSARFSHFVRSPRVVRAYLPHLGTRQPEALAGHNPLGGWAVIALLAALLVQAVSGLFATDDISLYGPLAERVSSATAQALTSLHHSMSNVLVLLIGLHLLAIAWHALFKRENLARAMVSGRKQLAAASALRFVGNGRAALLLAGTSALVWAVVTFGPG